MKLTDYIAKHCNHNKSELARIMGVKPQQVDQWVAKGFIIIDGVLYSPRRPVIEKDRGVTVDHNYRKYTRKEVGNKND